MKDLVVIIMTFYLGEVVKPAKFLSKVCHKIEEKPMIQIAVENALKLNPEKIIIYASKNNIQCINKVLKHEDYSKMISFCICDSEMNKERKLSYGSHCYKNKNVLFTPANYPLLSTKTLFRMISENRNIKVENTLFYLKKDSIELLDEITKLKTKDFMVPKIELTKVDTLRDLENVKKHLAEKNKKIKMFMKKNQDV